MYVSVAGSCKCAKYTNKQVTWQKFIQLFNDHRTRTEETYAAFMSFDKDRQSKIKDIGGFVGGKLTNGSRKQVQHRDLITLDVDAARSDFIDKWELAFDDTQAIIHSTHKHSTQQPRLRIITPLSRPVDCTEYQAAARKLAEHLGIEQFDRTTYDPGRMMFWQSSSSDAEVIYQVFEGAPLNVDALLDEYEDYRNIAEWPKSARETAEPREAAAKKPDPLKKSGIIGQFCRTYNIHEAIATFIPDVYEPCEEDPNRYTYIGGTTRGGMVVYDDLFSYSYHDHDPTCGIECNAFDLIRLHKFGHLDGEATAQSKMESLPSYKAMTEFAAADENVRATIDKERLEDFEDEASEEDTDEDRERFAEELREVESHLKRKNKLGDYPLISGNIDAMFKYHPMLKGILAYDEFKSRIVLISDRVRWRKVNPRDNAIKDIDDAEIRRIFEKYGMIGKDRIYDAILTKAQKKRFHPVRDYLKALKWDGQQRIATVLTDYFGGADNTYNRFISELFFKAAVMRVFCPGCKFDTMLTLKGEQGCGKSTFCKVLGGDWFSDDTKDLRSKDAVEGLQGVWIHEFSELSAMKRADAELIKSFLSTSSDRFRKAYGRRTGDYPRQCVFVATTNEVGFLYDKTGNRRFLIFEVPKNAKPKKDVFKELPEERNQLWAEAYALVKAENFKTDLSLPKEIEAMAREVQKGFMQDDPIADVIEKYLEIPLPDDWDEWEITDRKEYIQNALKEKQTETERVYTRKRDKVCTAEIWNEALQHSDAVNLSWQEAQNINRILDNLPEWERIKNTNGAAKNERFSKYGVKKGFRRIKSD